MTRRKHQEEEHENHERWLVSYADFITLLFAFFVVMYAISSINEGKYRQLADAVSGAFTGRPVPEAARIPQSDEVKSIGKVTAERRLQEAMARDRKLMTAMADNLSRILKPLVSEGKVRVTQTALGVNVEINASVLFMPGEAKLSAQSTEVLTALAQALSQGAHYIRIEGFTDNAPIANREFASNWELSSVRASSVARLFIANGVVGSRLTVIGHADNRPVVDNATPENRARNRRVLVSILSAQASEMVAREVP